MSKIKTPSNNKLGGRILFNMILFGFMGQVA